MKTEHVAAEPPYSLKPCTSTETVPALSQLTLVQLHPRRGSVPEKNRGGEAQRSGRESENQFDKWKKPYQTVG